MRQKTKSTGIRMEQLKPGVKVRLRKSNGIKGNIPLSKGRIGRVATIVTVNNRADYDEKYPITIRQNMGSMGPLNIDIPVALCELDPAYGVKSPTT